MAIELKGFIREGRLNYAASGPNGGLGRLVMEVVLDGDVKDLAAVLRPGRSCVLTLDRQGNVTAVVVDAAPEGQG